MSDFGKILDTIFKENKNVDKKELLQILLNKVSQDIINDSKYIKEFEYTSACNRKEKKVLVYYLEAWRRSDRSDKPKVIYLNDGQKAFVTKILTAMLFEDDGTLFEAETFKVDSLSKETLCSVSENLQPLGVQIDVKSKE
jgi:hypothetical protein